MAQVPEGKTYDDTKVDQAIPKASTDINPGDVVVISRSGDPRSLQAISSTPGRIKPISAAAQGQWLAGVANGKFNNDGTIVNSTTYAAPTSDNAVKFYRDGVHRLAISNTSGKKGDYVRYSSGASGAQIFVIDNRKIGWAIGRIFKDFSGASANDPQQVEMLVHQESGQSIYYWLENRVLAGCTVKLATQPASRVCVGNLGASTTSVKNVVVIQGKICSIARNKSLAYGGVGSASISTIRFKWVVARSGSFAVRSCSVKKGALTSYTVAGVTIGLFRPITMTAGEVPIALLIQFSAANQSNARIKNLPGPSLLPAVGSWGV